ncbi:MAG TPA: D-aminoacylase [Longimicrobiales bacterium]|nr:D-aminoacylase [Longimicrobiales bacterium]
MRKLMIPGLILLIAGCAATPAAEPYDLLITGGTVVDGTGAPGFTGDIGVRDGRIVRVSRTPLPQDLAERVIDATGHVVAPGFIDLHAHLDPIMSLPHAESHVRQGVTTGLGNPDGGGFYPIASYLDSLTTLGVGMNVAFLVGHNTVRSRVMGSDNRAPTAAELAEMREMVDQAMRDGAYGISTGLRYTPGFYADTDEVVALSEVAAGHGGIYTSHLRDEGFELMDGVGEALEIGRRADIPVILTHHKVVGAPMWGSSERTLAMVDSARAAGTDVMVDQYPYTATHTGISILIPPWALAGGTREFLRRVDDPVLRDSIVDGIIWNIINDRGGNDLRRVQFARVTWDRSLEGQTLHDLAEREGLPSTPETGAQLIIDIMRRGGANGIFHVLDEGDVERIMQHPWTAIASDGRLTALGDGHPHPRAYGTFPRVLGEYVRERGVLTLEEAVRKMTSLPADRLGMSDRGRIAEGAIADLVIFDPAAVTDRATFQEPHQYPDGIPYVIVNGVVTVDAGEFMDNRPGVVLRRGR